MSIKTLRKRIALVAVSALGVGLLSVAPASAAADDGLINAIGGTGKLASSQALGQLYGTGTYLVGGMPQITSTNGGYYTISGGTWAMGYTGCDLTTPDDSIISAGGLAVTLADGDCAKANITAAAGGTVVITGYLALGGVPQSKLTITVASASVAGVMSPAKSYVTWQSADGDTGTSDDAGANSATTGNALFLNILLNDAYGADVTSTSGALVVSASTGATVKISANAGAVGGAGTFSTAVSSANPSDLNVYVAEATAGAGWKGTVTVTYNGVTVATKSGTITGAPKTINLIANKIGKVGTNEDQISFTVQDAAGNYLDTNDGTYDATDYILYDSSNESVVSDAYGTEDNDVAASTLKANGDVVCEKAGTSDVSLLLLYAGTYVISNTVTLKCGGAAYSYTASLDKASYIQGEIATLTIQFLDLNGNPANSYDAITTADGDSTISAPMLTRVGGDTILAATKPNVDGKVTHTFTVGTNSGLTAGSYNMVVNYVKTLTNATARTVAYTVGTGQATGVSNAEVLAAIVKLIASINKQIKALQKSLKK